MKPLVLFLISGSIFLDFGLCTKYALVQNSPYAPTTMNLLGEVQIPYGTTKYFVHDSYFIACTDYNGPNQLIVVDISNPSNLQWQSFYLLSGTGTKNFEGGDPYEAELRWPYFYHPHEEGLEIADLSDPSNPTIACRYEIPEATGRGGVISVAGNRALFSHARSSALEILDLSDIRSPRRLALVDVEDDPANNRTIEARSIHWDGGRYAYIYAGCNTGMGIARQQLLVLDLQALDKPVIVSRILCDNGKRLGSDMLRIGERVFYPFFITPRQYIGIQTIEMDNPLSPVLYDPVPTPDTIYTIYPYRNGFLTLSNSTALAYYRMNGLVPVKISEFSLPCDLHAIVPTDTTVLGIGTRIAAYYLYVLEPDGDSGVSNFADYP